MTPIMPGQPGYDPSIPVLAMMPRVTQVETLLSVMDFGRAYRVSTLARMLGMHVVRVRHIIGWALQWGVIDEVPARGHRGYLYVRVK